MHFLAVIFAFWIGIMSIMPCADNSGVASLDEQVHFHTEQHSHDHDHERAHADHCSPFCVCHCCHTHFTFSTASIKSLALKATLVLPIYAEPATTQQLFALFRPPQA